MNVQLLNEKKKREFQDTELSVEIELRNICHILEAMSLLKPKIIGLLLLYFQNLWQTSSIMELLYFRVCP